MRGAARLLATICLTLLTFVAPREAWAWVEWHHQGDDLEATVADWSPDGTVLVSHVVRYRLHMGPLKSIDVSGILDGAVLEGDAFGTLEGAPHGDTSKHAKRSGKGSAELDDAGQFALRTEMLPEKPTAGARVEEASLRANQTVRLHVADPRGLRQRGVYAFRFQYRVPLRALVLLDGAFARVRLQAPPAVEGYDGGRAVLRLPAAARAPEALDIHGALLLPGLAQVTRDGTYDRVEVTRPHVTKGEAPLYAVRLDARNFAAWSAASNGAGATPAARAVSSSASPPAVVDVPQVEHRLGLLLTAVVALAFGGLLVLALRMKHQQARAGAADARALLVPVAPRVRLPAVFALGALIPGLQATVHWRLAYGLLPVLLLLLTEMPPKVREIARPLALRPVDVFSSRARPWREALWDGRSLPGATAFLVLALVAGFVAWCTYRVSRLWPLAVVADASVLVPLFFSGLGPRSQSTLRRLFDKLRAAPTPMRVVPYGLPSSAEHALLLVKPQHALPGFVGIEAASDRSVRVRVREASPCERKLRALWPSLVASPGRDADERFVAFQRASVHSMYEQVEVLVAALSERRTRPSARSANLEKRQALG